MMMLMVMPCYDHAQMMLKCKANIWGVTQHEPSDQTDLRNGVDVILEGGGGTF
jgi:hypothetical protein